MDSGYNRHSFTIALDAFCPYKVFPAVRQFSLRIEENMYD